MKLKYTIFASVVLLAVLPTSLSTKIEQIRQATAHRNPSLRRSLKNIMTGDANENLNSVKELYSQAKEGVELKKTAKGETSTTPSISNALAVGAAPIGTPSPIFSSNTTKVEADHVRNKTVLCFAAYNVTVKSSAVQINKNEKGKSGCASSNDALCSEENLSDEHPSDNDSNDNESSDNDSSDNESSNNDSSDNESSVNDSSDNESSDE